MGLFSFHSAPGGIFSIAYAVSDHSNRELIMKILKTVILACAVSSIAISAPTYADSPNKAAKEALKEQMKMEREQAKRERELEREDRKRYQEMEREDKKDRDEMQRERSKHGEEMKSKATKYGEEMKKKNRKNKK